MTKARNRKVIIEKTSSESVAWVSIKKSTPPQILLLTIKIKKLLFHWTVTGVRYISKSLLPYFRW